jgi:3-methyladenine DNA glycosylase AlkD
MNPIDPLYTQIVHDLEQAGQASLYTADANEPDPRYQSYGVRAAGKKKIFATHRAAIRALPQAEQIALATRLIQSRFGEQQSIGLSILEKFTSNFTPDRFSELDTLVRCLHGWSKVDSFTGSLLRDVLFQHPDEMKKLVRQWNSDDDMWLRRTSVVLFTRKVAQSGRYTDFALEMCSNLIGAAEDLVQKGVGWALKDLMRVDKVRMLDYVRALRQQGVSSTITLYAIKELKGEERAKFLASC